MIQIRAWYGGWKEVTEVKAKDFISFLIYGMMCPDAKKIEIAQRHLKGISVMELLKTIGEWLVGGIVMNGKENNGAYYFITYEYDGKSYEVTVQPDESPIIRMMSITDAGGKITDIREQKA